MSSTSMTKVSYSLDIRRLAREHGVSHEILKEFLYDNRWLPSFDDLIEKFGLDKELINSDSKVEV